MHRISGRSQLLLVEKSAGMFSTVLCNGYGVEKQLPAATPAKDLIAATEVDYQEYRKGIKHLREEHPLFEDRIDISVADFEDFVAEALLLPSMLQKIDPVSFFVLGELLHQSLQTEDDDPEKNRKNIEKHGISFKNAARVFFDYDRIELYDEAHSGDEDRYDTIGSIFAGNLTVIGNLQDTQRINDILFVVYTERAIIDEGGRSREVTRLISARLATSFERGVYYGKRS